MNHPEHLSNGELVSGVDVGGTKVHILDTASRNLHRYNTAEFTDIYSVLDDYFGKLGAMPVQLAVVMAEPRDDASGIIKLTNANWPACWPKPA